MPRLPENRDEAILTSKSVLFVEGKDEVGLFKALIKDMGLTLGVDIQVWSADGKDNYRPKFAAFLRIPGFEQVRSYGLIRDADQNAENALRSVQHMLRDEGQPCPVNHAACVYDNNNDIKVGIYIMPGYGATRGMLEDLCLRSIAEHPIQPHMEAYIAQVKLEMQSDAPRNESKAKMQAFLAGMKECVPQLGVAAGKGYWPLEHEAFTEIRDFIRDLTTFN